MKLSLFFLSKVSFYLIFLFSVCMHSQSNAQTITTPFGDSLVMNAPFDFSTEGYIYLKNNDTDSVQFTWRRFVKETPAEWLLSVCDLGHCYAGFPATGDMLKVAPNENAFLKIIVNPYQTQGEGILKFRVSPKEDIEDYQDVTFIINTIVSSNAEVENWDFKIFPNPAQQLLTIESSLNIDQIFLYNKLGQVVIEKNAAKEMTNNINLEGFENGIYLLELHSANRIISRPIFVIQY